ASLQSGNVDKYAPDRAIALRTSLHPVSKRLDSALGPTRSAAAIESSATIDENTHGLNVRDPFVAATATRGVDLRHRGAMASTSDRTGAGSTLVNMRTVEGHQRHAPVAQRVKRCSPTSRATSSAR